MQSTLSTTDKVKTPEAVIDAVKMFHDLMVKSAKTMYEAAKLYVAILDSYPEWIDYFRSKFVQYPMGVWRQIERVGRDLVIPEFLPWYGNHGIARLEKLSLADQKRYAVEPIEVLVVYHVGTERKYDTRKIHVYDLSLEQVAQVFDIDSIRSLSAQRSYVDTMEQKNEAKEYVKPWKKVDDNHVLIKTGSAGMIFTRDDVVEILSVMTRGVKKKS